MISFDELVEDAKAAGWTLYESGTGFLTHCPYSAAHSNGDANPSFWIRPMPDGDVFLGCLCAPAERAEWFKAAFKRLRDGPPSDVPPDGPVWASGGSHVGRIGPAVAAWDYAAVEGGALRHVRHELLDGAGDPLLRKDGKAAKVFLWERFDRATDHWTNGLNGHEPCLYRESEIPQEGGVYIVESERSADMLRELGLPATTHPLKWTERTVQILEGRGFALPDNDEAGKRAAAKAVAAVHAHVVELPGLEPGQGPDDWLENGGTVEQLTTLANTAATPRPPIVIEAPTAEGEVSPAVFAEWCRVLAERVKARGKALALPFRRLADLLAGAPRDITWLWEGRVARGGKTLLASEVKKGKSTLAYGIAAAVLEGNDLLGFATKQAGVLYLTEEASLDAIRLKAERFGIDLENPRFLILRHVEVRSNTWEQTVEAILESARVFKEREGLEDVLVVFDVLNKWAGLTEGQENDNSKMQGVLDALDPLSEAALSLLILCHAGWGARRSRGASSIAGVPDLLLFLDAPPDGGGSSTRVLIDQGGRFGDPRPSLAYRLDAEEGLASLGEGVRRSGASKMSEILTALESLGAGATTAQLAEKTGWSERATRRWLVKLEDAGRVVRSEEMTTDGNHTTWRRAHWKAELEAVGEQVADGVADG